MLQSPNSDGPPSLDAFDAARRATGAMSGPAAVLGTARVTVSDDDDVGDDLKAIDEAAYSCVTKAISDLSASATARLIHVTFTPDLAARAVGAGVHRASGEAGNVPLLGRSVAKKNGTPRTIETLVLADGNSVYTGAVVRSDGKGVAEVSREAVAQAQATAGYSPGEVIFGLFVTTSDEDAARSVLGSGIPMYGGRASEGDNGAVLLGGQVIDAASTSVGTVVTYVSGSASFLISAVVKSWAQPKFVDALAFLKPKYTGDAGEDLLQAIKFDDREMFEQCLRVTGANHQWATRQHQTPLLAAAGRGRTHMVQRIVDEGGDVTYRNDGGFNAVMYTLRLTDYGEEFVETQLDILRKAGADVNDTEVIIPQRRDEQGA